MTFETELRKFYEELLDRKLRFSQNVELLHACLGLSGEAGEVIDIIKKHLAYGKELDNERLVLELGDCLHYLCRIIDLSGFTLQEVMDGNIKKLNKRFPNGYTNKDAINQTEK